MKGREWAWAGPPLTFTADLSHRISIHIFAPTVDEAVSGTAHLEGATGTLLISAMLCLSAEITNPSAS